MRVFRYSLLVSTVWLGISLDFVHCKSLTHTDVSHQSSGNPYEASLQPPKSATVESRRVASSWSDDGTWEGSARLPSSSQSGGNDHSRYKISRDGSLSIALQEPQNGNRRNYEQGLMSANNDGRDRESQFINPASQQYDRKYSPTELRSFSVVLSDVDVVGNYDRPDSPKDSYSKSGVSSYNIHSSSVHRMNASWKLSPSRHPSPTSQELLKFLALFSSKEKEESMLPNPSHSQYKKELPDFSPVIKAVEINADHSKKESIVDDPDLPPFTTWFESSRNLRSDNETTNANITEIKDVQFNGNETKQAILQELITTVLEKLNETTEEEDTRSGRGIVLLPNVEDDRSEIARVLGDNPKNTNINDTDKRADTTKLEDDAETTESPTPLDQGTEKMMKATDPQQTATSLKKLISNLIKSDGGNMEGKNGAEIVNILVSPSNDNDGDNENSETRQNQKILFLKTAEVKRLLETALSDPSAREAAQKIASALHVPSITDRGFNYLNSGNTSNKNHLTNISTPDGFPLTGSGFLNLHHPNLQFHQALHHLVANGSAPTSISATTKTNVINIFVINYNNSPNQNSGMEGLHQLLAGGMKMKKPQNEQTKLPIPLDIKPMLLESVHEVSYGADLSKPIHYSDISSKVPTTAEPLYRRTPNKPMATKMYKTTTNLWSHSTPSTVRPNRIHILDLLPGDIKKFTAVQYGPSMDQISPQVPTHAVPRPQNDYFSDFLPDNSRDPTKLVNRDTEAPIFPEYMQFNNSSTKNNSDIEIYLRRTTTRIPTRVEDTPLPPELAHLSWIFKNQSPPTPTTESDNPVRVQKGGKGDRFAGGSSYDDPDFPDSADQGDSMMETDETSNIPFPNFQLFLKNGSIQASVPLGSVSGNDTNSTLTLQTCTDTVLLNETLNASISTPIPSKLTETKKPPAFTLFASKIPEGGFNNTEVKTDNNKLRKVFTALGYSAMPTIAAGVAATWPYWVPLIATGRRRRRDLRESIPVVEYSRAQGIQTLGEEEEHGKSFDTNYERAIRNGTSSSQPMFPTKRADALQKSTKNEEPESAYEKWIKIKVITDPSPTLGNVKAHKNSNISSTDNNNNRLLLLGNGEPQDTDVPLLKNFLKNVLTNEWSISSAAADPSNLQIQQHSTNHPNNKVHSNFAPVPSTKVQPTKAITIKLHERDPTVPVNELPFPSSSSALSQTKVPDKDWETFKPAGQNVSLLITPTRKNTGSSKFQKESVPMMRNKLAGAIQLSQDATQTDLTNGRTIDSDTNAGRSNRRLHKLKKTVEISDENQSENEEDGSQLAQSLTAISSHLLDTGDESLENSSERDVYINKNEDATSTDNDTDEALSDEDSDQQAQQENGIANPTVDPKTSISTWHDENEDTDEDKMIEKQKSDGSPTTPKGLTTWSAVNGGSSSASSYVKGSVQKLPSDYTVSGQLSFSTDRPATTIDMVVIKDRVTYPTTEVPRTTKANNSATKSINRRKPYNKNKKVVQPSKFVKPPLDEVTAEAIGSDATHTIYKTKVTEPVQSKISPSPSASYNPYTTKKPLWPYQMPTKKIVTTRRPIPFSRITSKPKNPYVKRPNSVLTLTTPTTTTPASTTVYHRNPGAPVMYPFPSISFTNLGFMDFLRSQIIPRIGLSLISFMAASPLILSMLGASVGRRKKRDVSSNTKVEKAIFESNYGFDGLPKFSTIKRKLEKLQTVQNKKKNGDKSTPKQLISTFTEILDNFFHSQTFSILKSKLVKLVGKDGRKRKHLNL